MERKFNFVFITTNLINGKQYVGDHSTDVVEDAYLGSGRPYFKNALKQYGKNNFKREIIEFFPTKKEAFEAQKKYIIQYNTLVPNGYNLSPTGGNHVKGCHSEETRDKISKNVSKTLTGRSLKDSTKKLLSKIMLDKKLVRSEDFKNNIRTKLKNKIHTEQSKANMRQGHVGLVMPARYKYTLISPNNEEHIFLGEKELMQYITEHKMSIRLIKNSYNKGVIHSNQRVETTKNTENWEILQSNIF